MEKQCSERLYFLGLQNHCRLWLQPEIKRHVILGRKAMTNLDSILKGRYYFANKCLSSHSYGFSSSHYGCDSWAMKKAERWRIDAFELWYWRRLWRVPKLLRVLESLDCKEIKPVHPKGNQSWIFFGRSDAEAPILWPPDAKNWLIGKDPDAGKDWRQEEKGTTEDEMSGCHYQLDGHEFE